MNSSDVWKHHSGLKAQPQEKQNTKRTLADAIGGHRLDEQSGRRLLEVAGPEEAVHSEGH